MGATITSRHRFSFSQHALLEVCHYFPHPRKQRARGNAGCTVHPRSRVQSYQGKRTRAYRSTEITRHPRTQWLYGLCRALPGARARFVTVAGGMNSTGLMPASGIRTTRIFRPHQALNVKSTVCDHRSPAPRYDDSRNAPLPGAGWGEYRTNFNSGKQKYFRMKAG